MDVVLDGAGSEDGSELVVPAARTIRYQRIWNPEVGNDDQGWDCDDESHYFAHESNEQEAGPDGLPSRESILGEFAAYGITLDDLPLKALRVAATVTVPRRANLARARVELRVLYFGTHTDLLRGSDLGLRLRTTARTDGYGRAPERQDVTSKGTQEG